ERIREQRGTRQPERQHQQRQPIGGEGPVEGDGHGRGDGRRCETYARARAWRRDAFTPSSTLVSGAPSCHSTTGAPARSYCRRRPSRRSFQRRKGSSPTSPGGVSAYGRGETSTMTRSKPRARRSSNAPIARSSSSGVSASTSAFGGSVPRGGRGVSFPASG